MNVFSRSIIFMLLLSGTTQPVNWKYVIPWTTTILCVSGWAFSAFNYKKNVDELERDIKSEKLKNQENNTKLEKLEKYESFIGAFSIEEDENNSEVLVVNLATYPRKTGLDILIGSQRRVLIRDSEAYLQTEMMTDPSVKVWPKIAAESRSSARLSHADLDGILKKFGTEYE